jgi:hypothetical protein
MRWTVILATLLIIPNIMMDVLKWKLAMVSIRKLKMILAVKSILSGLTFGILAPGRVGDYGGRMVF